MVLNPGTIVNTEREVILLRAQLKVAGACLMPCHSGTVCADEATPEEETEKIKKLEAIGKPPQP